MDGIVATEKRLGRGEKCQGQGSGNPIEVHNMITSAYDHILEAETSCNFYWGSQWVCRSFDTLEKAYHLLDTAMSVMHA